MSDPQKFHLRITAGPSYDASTHHLVHVNTSQPTHISSSKLDASISVRIQNYRGLPSSSPETSPYFTHPNHKNDLYSISFSFTPKEDIQGDELLFGNDFENPIKDHLPPGFGAALRIVRWAIDPGLEGDVYGEKPYLYGPALSSINVLRIGEKGRGKSEFSKEEAKKGLEGEEEGIQEEQAEHDAVVIEGADGAEANKIRHDAGIPDDSPKRMKYFLSAEHRRNFTFEKGREYRFDFFNPYLDFNDLALKLPGMSLYLMRFWDGQPLRYTLKKKNAETDQELFVIVFTLVSEEELEKEKGKWGKEGGKSSAGTGNGAVKGSERNEKISAGSRDDDVD